MAVPDWKSTGDRIALLRHRKGVSVRQAATDAGVDKNTIVRLEKGLPVRMSTLTRICKALDTTPGRQLLPIGTPDQVYRLCRASERRWEKDPELINPADPKSETTRLEREDFRWRLGWNGLQAGFNGFLDCELFGGSIVSSVIELFEMSNLRSFDGEEMLFCLHGQVMLQINDENLSLSKGDAVCLRANELHRCGPIKPLKFGQAPPAILSVRVMRSKTPSPSW